MSDSLWLHELQHARIPCSSLFPRVSSNLCPLSRWCHPTIASSIAPLLLQPSIVPSIRVFSNDSALHIRWPKYWSFSFNISPSKEHPGLISFRMDPTDFNLKCNTEKQKHYFVNKSLSSQGYGLSSSRVWMWELDYKESWVPKNWCFWAVVLE